MSRYTGPKLRLSRREGINLFGNDRYTPGKKKNYAPGMHGPKGTFSKPSEFGRQLREKQKLKRLYGITERHMTNYFAKATKKKEMTGNALLKLLETRLDNVVFKAGLAKSRPQARQMVNHGLFKVNGKRMNIPSCQVELGDLIEATDKAKKYKLFMGMEEQKFAPAKWLKVDYGKIQAEMARELEADDLEKAVQMNLVVEYYSK